jgi:hypothetical protein
VGCASVRECHSTTAPLASRRREAQRRTCLPEPFGEAPACLLKAGPLVEGMSVFAAYGRRQEDEAATPSRRLLLHLFHQGPPNSTPAVPLVHNDCAELRCRGVVCDREADMETREADNLPVQLRDDESVCVARRQALDAFSDGVSRGGISKLPDQGYQRLCVAWTRIANRELHQHEKCRRVVAP